MLMSSPTPSNLPAVYTDGRQGIKRMKNIPEGMSVADAVRRGMAEHPRQSNLGAAVAGIDQRAYRFIKRLLVLSEQNLPTADKEIILSALDEIEKNRIITAAYRSAGAVVEKYSRRESSYTVGQRRLRFDKTVANIGVTCESTGELEIPRDLTQKAVNEAIASLSASIQQIGLLIRRLTGETTEQN